MQYQVNVLISCADLGNPVRIEAFDLMQLENLPSDGYLCPLGDLSVTVQRDVYKVGGSLVVDSYRDGLELIRLWRDVCKTNSWSMFSASPIKRNTFIPEGCVIDLAVNFDDLDACAFRPSAVKEACQERLTPFGLDLVQYWFPRGMSGHWMGIGIFERFVPTQAKHLLGAAMDEDGTFYWCCA